MAINKRLLVKPPSTGITPSEHFGVVLYEGDGQSSHSINGGKFGAGAQFNKSGSSYITTDYNTKASNSVSFSFWMFWNGDNNTVSADYIFQVGSQPGGKAIYCFIHNTGFMRVQSVNSGYSTGVSTSAGTFSTNTWYHIGITIEGTASTNNVKIYVNGSLDVQGSSNKAVPATTAGTFIGNSTTTTSQGGEFWGKLDQFRIFDKELSSSEVSTLYAETVDTVESLDPLSEDTTDTLQVLGDSSCLATYRFENNEDDLSGNYDGTGTAIQYAAGRYGQAASFNGSSSKVILPQSTTNSIGSNGAFSVSFWFFANTGSLGSTERRMITLFDGIYIWIEIPTNSFLRYRVANSSPTNIENTGTTTITQNTWHHVALTGDSTNGIIAYLNGSVEISSASWDGTFKNGSGASRYNYNVIGAQEDDLGSLVRPFLGKLDQVRLFDKALSASEVTTLYNENSLVASYRFEGNANDDMRAYDGSASNVSYEYGLNFTPDFVWYKTRTQAYDHNISDSTRGTGKQVRPNITIAEVSATDHILSFDTGGFTVGAGGDANKDGDDYVAWCLKANGGTTSSNTDGSITTTVQANQDSGFSIIKYDMTVTTQTAFTIGHGLSAPPELVFFFSLDQSGSTSNIVYPNNPNKELVLDSNGAFSGATSAYWNTTAPSSTVINMGTAWGQYHSYYGGDTVAYAFHSVDGFSKIGSYTGNGSTSNIIETGFEPAFLMTKRTDTAGYNWYIWDNKRNLTNPRYLNLQADRSNAESDYSAYPHDFLSNGFEVKTSNAAFNASGGTYIYMAFAADPDTEAPTVAKSFSTVTYTGTGATQSIEGLGFQANLVWIKQRDAVRGQNWFDSTRGVYNLLQSNNTNANTVDSTQLTSFDAGGFTVGSANGVNASGGDFVAWAWKADDNEPTINTEGTVDSLVSANANAGFSIVKYEGNGTSGATIGHGLSAAPDMVIVKILNTTDDWTVYHSALGNTQRIFLNQTNATGTNLNMWNSTSPSSTTVTLGNDVNVNGSGNDYIAYCFHSVSNYSKIGSYSGSSSTVSVNVGFQPDFVMVKMYNITGGRWIMIDSVRGDGTLNNTPYVQAQDSAAEATNAVYGLEFTSTGFDAYNGTINLNSSGYEYIYMAFKIN